MKKCINKELCECPKGDLQILKKIGFMLLIVVSILSLFRILFLANRDIFTSDMATAVLIANEQIAAKSFFPEGWVYADSIWIATLNLLVIPFRIFLDDWLLCRELAVCVQTILATYVFYKTGKRITKYGFWFPILMLIPVSTVVLDNYYLQATYITVAMWYFIIFSGVLAFFEKKKYANIKLAASCGLMIILTIQSVRHLMSFMIPLIAGIFLFYITQWKKYKEIKSNIEKRHLIAIAVLLLSAVVGLGMQIVLKNQVTLETFSLDITVDDGALVLARMKGTAAHIFSLFGAVGGGKLISLTGVMRFARTIYCFFALLICPYYLYKHYGILNSGEKIFLNYHVVCMGLLMYTTIFTNVDGYARYLLPLYANSLILVIMVLGDLWKNEQQVILSLCVLALAVIGLYCHVHYNLYDYQADPESVCDGYPLEDNQAIMDFLIENDLTKGYGNYWCSAISSVLTNGQVEVLALKYDSGDLEPYYWLNSLTWYEEREADEKCFLWITKEEIESNLIPQNYFDQASEVVNYEDLYTFLIFEKDIFMYKK